MITHVSNAQQLSKWDFRFLTLAAHVASWSKGPRTCVGAVIAGADKRVAAMGFNGAPAGFDDDKFLLMSREEQHKIVVHAERNALAHMSDRDRYLAQMGLRYTLYVSPMLPCEKCAEKIIESGIKRVVAKCGQMSQDWHESAERAFTLFEAAGVEVVVFANQLEVTA